MDAFVAQTEGQFYELAKSAPDAIYFAANGHIRYANPAAQRLFGATSLDQLVGMGVLDRVHPDYRTLVAERMRHLSDIGETAPLLEETYLRMDGTPVEVEVIAVPFRFNEEDGGLVFVRDISLRKQVEEGLRMREALLQSMINTTADGFWISNQEGQILEVNDAYCRLSGYARSELLSMPYIDLEALESPQQMRARIERIRFKGSDLFETVHRTKTGGLLPLEVNITPRRGRRCGDARTASLSLRRASVRRYAGIPVQPTSAGGRAHKPLELKHREFHLIAAKSMSMTMAGHLAPPPLSGRFCTTVVGFDLDF